MSEHAVVVEALLLSGTVGAGKTALVAEMSEVLSEREVPHAAVDLDALIWQWPADSHWNSDLLFENLRSIWPNYLRRSPRYLLMARVVEEAAEVERFQEALPGVRLRLGRVTGPEELRRLRLASRMQPGPSLDWHLRRTSELEALLDQRKLEEFIVLNGNGPLRETALEVLGRLGWRV